MGASQGSIGRTRANPRCFHSLRGEMAAEPLMSVETEQLFHDLDPDGDGHITMMRIRDQVSSCFRHFLNFSAV